jgi:phosphate transport system substrate-binding protein
LFPPLKESHNVNTLKRRHKLIVGAIALSLVAAACGGDDSGDDDTTTTAAAEVTTTAAEGDTTTEPAGTDETTEAPETTEAMTDTTEGGAPAGDLSGSIVVSGSSTVEPISIAVGNAFGEANPDVAISVTGPGTGDGFAQFCAGETDISDASRPIKGEEAETCAANGIDFIELKVAVDGLSVVTSAQNSALECLSFVDLYALLGPDAAGVNNWSDASAAADEIAATVTDMGAVHTPYPDAPLAVTAPGEESGTFDSFVEIVIAAVGEELGVEDALPRPDYTPSPNDNVIVEGIGSNPTSLGWVGFAFVEENLDTIKPLQVDGGDGCVEPTPETIASNEYPIARDLFIYVDAAKAESNPALAAYVDYYVTEGITTLVGSDEGQVPYVALNDEAVAETQAVWEAKTTGTREG